ncbi:MAG: hypothetical protein JWQ35_1864 [Bacteriovoracaceae bacterium]|nr:hypothetical protein [Bacteriovoracaceae bacterium]
MENKRIILLATLLSLGTSSHLFAQSFSPTPSPTSKPNRQGFIDNHEAPDDESDGDSSGTDTDDLDMNNGTGGNKSDTRTDGSRI